MITCAICGGKIESTDGYTMDYYPERDTYTLHHTKNGAPYCGRGLFKRGEREFTHYDGVTVPVSDVTIVGAPSDSLEKHFEHLHDNPPAPFNPLYNPLADTWSDEVSAAMEAEGFYDTHSREECAIEFRWRYEAKSPQFTA